MAIAGDHYTEMQPLRAVDFMIEEVRQSSVGTSVKKRAVEALRRLDREGKIDSGAMNILEGFDWGATEEGAAFWRKINEAPLMIDEGEDQYA